MTSKTPSTVVFFVDRSLGSRFVAKALREAGAHVEVHDDHFPQETPDTDWLIEVGQRGWVVLSKDSAIRRNRAEPNEAELLIGLIEILLKDWYIARHERQQHLKSIVAVAQAKKQPKSLLTKSGRDVEA